MKMRYYLLAFAALAGMVSCDKYLDQMPDNRTEIDTEEKVAALLVSAYSRHNYTMITNFVSDDMDNNAEVVTSAPGEFFHELWNWKDITYTNNSSPQSVWEDLFSAIACANQALEAIDEMGGPDVSQSLGASYGEALMCRAYAHFVLVNLFCLNYNSETSDTDLGIPYMDAPERGLNPAYERGNVKEVYERIEQDIEEGMPYVRDDYTAPKYHFTRQAAYAFAARFYLFYEKWQKAIEYADMCLGAEPQTIMRNYSELQNNYASFTDARRAYNSSSNKCNLLINTGYSNIMYYFGNYSGSYKYYCYSSLICQTEGLLAPMPWKGDPITSMVASDLRWRTHTYNSSALSYTILWKVGYEFEYTNPVAGTGYAHTVYPPLKVDETLLVRAEAYIMLKQYEKAMEDLNLWCNNFYSAKINMTPESVTEFYNQMKYYKWDEPTAKKHLHPAFAIDAEGSTQESMLQLLLNCRRTENWGEGLRWFDIKRYGIKIYRRAVNGNGQLSVVTDSLEVNDPRRAIQVPVRCIDAGLEPNPRNNQ